VKDHYEAEDHLTRTPETNRNESLLSAGRTVCIKFYTTVHGDVYFSFFTRTGLVRLEDIPAIWFLQLNVFKAQSQNGNRKEGREFI